MGKGLKRANTVAWLVSYLLTRRREAAGDFLPSVPCWSYNSLILEQRLLNVFVIS